MTALVIQVPKHEPMPPPCRELTIGTATSMAVGVLGIVLAVWWSVRGINRRHRETLDRIESMSVDDLTRAARERIAARERGAR